MISFWLDLEPVAKGRPRLGRGGNVYTPAETRNFEESVRWMAKKYQPAEPISGPVRLLLTFYIPKPKRPKDRYPTTKPDFDNLAKSVTDALNGIMWKDDSQVVEAHVYKRYEYPGMKPCIWVTIADADADEKCMVTELVGCL